MLLVDVYRWATPADPQNQDLKKQLAAAIAIAAVQVLSEATSTTNHANRILWAKRAIATANAPHDMALQMIWGVMANVAIQNEITASGTVPDGDMQFTVNSLVDTYAP